jgi:hypothetical protein
LAQAFVENIVKWKERAEISHTDFVLCDGAASTFFYKE